MEDPKLDGTDVIKPVPFDAHESVVRGPHTFEPGEGYQKAEPVAVIEGDQPGQAQNEYPKAIDHNEAKTEPVIARDEDHEDELKAAAAPAPAPATGKAGK